MKKIYLIMTLCMMMLSCKPDGGNGRHEDHEYVDLGLSVKWATCNIGASSPEEYGDYFAWGETSPNKAGYRKDNCITYDKTMNDISGNAQYDAARTNWGGDWRMPTKAEIEELIYHCTWIWTTQNGVNGYNVTGPNGTSIFLPVAGYRSWWSLYEAGTRGGYWSSSPYGDCYAYELCLYYDYRVYHGYDYNGYYGMYHRCRCDGRSVRPVIE